MDISNISLGLAFLAGLASFLSPCVFALVPAYVGYLGGRSVAYAGGEGAQVQGLGVLRIEGRVGRGDHPAAGAAVFGDGGAQPFQRGGVEADRGVG